LGGAWGGWSALAWAVAWAREWALATAIGWATEWELSKVVPWGAPRALETGKEWDRWSAKARVQGSAQLMGTGWGRW